MSAQGMTRGTGEYMANSTPVGRMASLPKPFAFRYSAKPPKPPKKTMLRTPTAFSTKLPHTTMAIPASTKATMPSTTRVNFQGAVRISCRSMLIVLWRIRGCAGLWDRLDGDGLATRQTIVVYL